MTEDRLALDFLGTFESLRMGPTFARGRRDERAGHVRELTISGSLAVALVRGPDDARAFRARVAVRSFGAAEWARVEKALVAEARFAAGLLAGRMPAGISAVFEAAGLSLVPLSLDEVAMDCSCERWPMPCVHLAAACYALARSFEEDPFEVFAWRGRGRDELLLHLRDLRGATALSPPARPGGAHSDHVTFGAETPVDAGLSLEAGSESTASAGAASAGAALAGPASAGAASAGAASAGAASAGAASAGAASAGAALAGPASAGAASAGVAFAGGDAATAAGFEPGGAAVADLEGGGSLGPVPTAGTASAVGSASEDGTASAVGSASEVGGGSAAGAGSGDDLGNLAEVSAFWGVEDVRSAPEGPRPGSVARPDALLDQLDPPPLAHDGRPIVDLLRAAYRVLPEE